MELTMLSFKGYISLSEATIVNQKKYLAGHKIELRKTAKDELKKALKGELELSNPVDNAEEIVLGKGSKFVYIKSGNKVYKIVGTESGINGSFNHTGGGKSDTHKKTRCKEAMSVILFKHFLENGNVINENSAIKELSKWGADESVYMPEYYKSASLQLDSFKKIKNMKSMSFEFQGGTYSAPIYAKAKALGGPASPDNWNPSDIWLFNNSWKDSIKTELAKIKHIQELNLWIRRNYILKNIVPISLKQASGKSSIELIEPIKYMNKKLDYDFSLNRVIIASSCKSVFIETNSGFQFKANARAAAGNPNLFYEGTMKNEGFSMGAIDKNEWDKFSKGLVPAGKTIKPSDALLKKSLETYKKYENVILKNNNDNLWNPNFDKMDNLTKQRYIHCADFLRFIMENYNEAIKFGFFASMKVSNINSLYIKIK
jgi:hypothetical protein